MFNESILEIYTEETRRYLFHLSSMEATRNLSTFILAIMIITTFMQAVSSPLILFLGSLSIFALFIFEARIQMTALVSLRRLELVEKNYFVQVLEPSIPALNGWQQKLAESYMLLQDKMGFLEALAIRLRETYLIIFIGLDLCWFSKLYLYPSAPSSLDVFIHRMDFGPFSGWITALFIVILWTTYFMLLVWLKGRKNATSSD